MSLGLQPQALLASYMDCRFRGPENTLDTQPQWGKNLNVSSAKQRSFTSL